MANENEQHGPRRFSWVRRLYATRRDETDQTTPMMPQELTRGPRTALSATCWPEDNASTRAMLSDREDYMDMDVATVSTGEGEVDEDDGFDRHSRSKTSTKSTAITSLGSQCAPPAAPTGPVGPAALHSPTPVLVNPGVASVHSSVAGPNRNDSASVVTIASSSRDWRRRRSIDTNVSTNALPPSSVLNNPI